MNENEIIAAFYKSGALMEKAIYEGNYKLNNREAKKMRTLYKKISVSCKDLFLTRCVPAMLAEGSFPVKIQTCNFLFDMQVLEKNAEEVLIRIAKEPDAQLFAHQAKLILHERGIKL